MGPNQKKGPVKTGQTNPGGPTQVERVNPSFSFGKKGHFSPLGQKSKEKYWGNWPKLERLKMPVTLALGKPPSWLRRKLPQPKKLVPELP